MDKDKDRKDDSDKDLIIRNFLKLLTLAGNMTECDEPDLVMPEPLKKTMEDNN